MAIFAHQTDLRVFAIGAELLRGIDCKKHCLILGLVRPIFVVAVLDHPFIMNFIMNDEIACVRHEIPSLPCGKSTANAERKERFPTVRQRK
jgi:hypothetical protein